MQEAGGHRWQHVPKTERHGRVHTSTVTCAVFMEDQISAKVKGLDESDIDIRYERGRGNGGQKVNKTESCVVIRHRPTGLTFRVDGRNRVLNEKLARERLAEAYRAQQLENHSERISDTRRDMVGSGQRGDKIRTYRVNDDTVIDHRSGLKSSLRRVKMGEIPVANKPQLDAKA